jgi:cell division protein FtsZ
MIDLDTSNFCGAKIRVIGVGGGGGNAVNNMIRMGLSGVDFLVANTDSQSLEKNEAKSKIKIGKDIRGLGAGGNPEVGHSAAQESEEELREMIKDSDMIFVTAGMGGGTGTGAAPYIAKVAQELGALVVGIVTKPFSWEGLKRSRTAESGISELRQFVDSLIVIRNQKLLDICSRNTTFNESFKMVDEVLFNATRGISDIITNPGVVNVDFADVCTVMKGMGDALMGIGYSTGENRAVEATQNALNSPLLEGLSIAGAQGVLVNITGGSDMTLFEVNEVGTLVQNASGEDANFIFGAVHNPEPSEDIMVTVVAAGFNRQGERQKIDERINIKKKSETSSLFGINSLSPQSFLNEHGRFPVLNNDFQPIEEESVEMSPSGYNELKKFDIPAFQRRDKELRTNEGMDMSLEQALMNSSKIDGNNIAPTFYIREYSTDPIAQKHLERPAFLRKIMD